MLSQNFAAFNLALPDEQASAALIYLGPHTQQCTAIGFFAELPPLTRTPATTAPAPAAINPIANFL
jgi:hypothetical protein